MTFREDALVFSRGLESPASVYETSGDFGARYGARLDLV